MRLYQHEMKSTWKSLMIWTLCVGGMGLLCILLFHSMEESLQGMGEAYANMGAFSTAFGMDKLSMATMAGFYATEIGNIHALGGAMFAAIAGAGMLSKEEAGHTSEFLHTLPIGRCRIIGEKYAAVLSNVVLFNAICVLLYGAGLLIMGEEMNAGRFALYHVMQLLCQLEIASICYCMSACTRKTQIGAGIGIAMLFYIIDMMCRIIPKIENLKYITPFYYANAADIFSGKAAEFGSLLIGGVILLLSVGGAFAVYQKKDLGA